MPEVVLDSSSDQEKWFYCAITINPLKQTRFPLLNEEIRRSPDLHAVNFPSQRPVKVRPVEGQQDGGFGGEGSDDHGTVLGFGKYQGSFPYGEGVGDKFNTGWISFSQAAVAVGPILGRLRRVSWRQ